MSPEQEKEVNEVISQLQALHAKLKKEYLRVLHQREYELFCEKADKIASMNHNTFEDMANIHEEIHRPTHVHTDPEVVKVFRPFDDCDAKLCSMLQGVRNIESIPNYGYARMADNVERCRAYLAKEDK